MRKRLRNLSPEAENKQSKSRLEFRLLAAIVVILWPMLGHIAAATEQHKLKFYGALDVFLPQNIDQGLINDDKDALPVLLAIGFKGASYSVATQSVGVGGRVGVQYRILNRTDIGASIGYIQGPSSKNTLVGSSFGVGGSAWLTGDRSVDYLRTLAEIQRRFPLSAGTSAALAAGLGIARGHVTQTCSATGPWASVVAGMCPASSSSAGWTGFSWEVTPSVSRQVGMMELSFGARYAVFPKFNGNDALSAISWNSFGFFAGAGF